jgi:hypothetical protein
MKLLHARCFQEDPIYPHLLGRSMRYEAHSTLSSVTRTGLSSNSNFVNIPPMTENPGRVSELIVRLTQRVFGFQVFRVFLKVGL